MTIKAKNPDEYIAQLPEERQVVVSKLRRLINKNLPKGFQEAMSYGMPGWVVSHEVYPDGYHCKPSEPLPFLSMASQKNFIAIYHMGIYADEELMKWFLAEYPKHCKRKLDMGKSCIRLKKMDDIPYQLIGQLASKMKAKEWIDVYEKNIKK